MAIVYLARERASGKSVAIKLLGPTHAGDAEALQRFAREARTVAVLEHPNIVRTLVVEELSGNAAAIVSEYVPGRTLRTLLRETGALPFDHAAAILRDIAAALAHAHRQRIVHRDVKPENIFIESETGRALLADFGIARPLDAATTLTTIGASIGTPTYMAPEQVAGRDVDERADVYSLGLVGWEMLSGARPWEGESLYAVLHKQQHERLPSLAAARPGIPAYLLRAVDGALGKAQSKRWRDGAEMLARLTPTPAARPRGMRWRHAAGVAALLAFAVVLANVIPGGSANNVADSARLDSRATIPASIGGEVAMRESSAVAPNQTNTPAPAGPATNVPPIAGTIAPTKSVPPPVVRSAEPRPAERAARPPSAARTRPTPARARALNASPRCRSSDSDDQRACLMAAIGRNDVALNRTYQALIARLRREAGGAREPAAVRALRGEQRAWLNVRDRSCRRSTPATSESLWGAERAPCFARVSARREVVLRSRLRK